MKRYMLQISICLSLISGLVYAQHTPANEYEVVVEDMFKAIQNKEFFLFKEIAEQAGLHISSDEYVIPPFWKNMKTLIEGYSECNGWDKIAERYVTERVFVVSYAFYTDTPRFITLTFFKNNSLWSIIAFNINPDFGDYKDSWGFLLTPPIKLANKQVSSVASENLINNGDFEKGSSGWSGDTKIVYETEEKKNKICKVELEDDEDLKFWKKIVLQDPKDLILRFKIKKSADYKGSEELDLYFEEEHASMRTTQIIPDNNEWNITEFKYTNFRDAKRINIIFDVKKGAGTLYFDDIEIAEQD